jgi:hypothetical protein
VRPGSAIRVPTSPVWTSLAPPGMRSGGLLAGQDVYAASWIAGIGVTWPAGEHVPATLLWQAPFAALPLWAGFFAFDFCSIAAIWAAVFILTRPRSPQAVLVAACCGAFAIITGGGQWTLMLGQPPAFELLGVAILVRARRPSRRCSKAKTWR